MFPNSFRWEQRLFCLSLLPLLIVKKPSVLYVGEYGLYTSLFYFRKWFGLSYGLILYTGGQAVPGKGIFDSKRDYVHHVTPAYISQCSHISENRQILLPHFVNDDFQYDTLLIESIKARAVGKKIIISIGLLDKKVKQMDKLVEALATQPGKYFPVLLGEASEDTPQIIAYLTENFGDDGFMLSNVPHASLGAYFLAADVFVSCSPKESFGLAMVEALYHGLPVVVHDFFETEWVLGVHGIRINANSTRCIMEGIQHALEPQVQHQSTERKLYAHKRYGLDNLRTSYLDFFNNAQLGMNLN